MAAPSKPSPKAPVPATEAKSTPVELKLTAPKTIIIGRGAECDVVVKDPKLSRRHCRLTRNETAFVLEDLGSKNGTMVDGLKITEPMTLQPNHTFKIGDTVLYLA